MKDTFKSLIAPVIAAFLAAAMANGAVWQWSKTAGTNASVDPSINWAEGMAPSSVDDSARAMMARLAEYRDDISGSVSTAGTATAYTLATNQGLNTTPADGQMVAFTAHATNGAGATLKVDGGNTYPLQSAAGSAAPTGAVVQGTPYQVKFSASSSAWILMNYYGQASLIPVGGVIAYTANSAPNSNFVLAYGQCISRTTYAVYFALVGTTFGACDGTTTFGVPDLRGRVIAGYDGMGGTLASRLTASYFGAAANIGAVGGNESQTLTVAQAPSGLFTNLTVSDTRAWGVAISTSSTGIDSGVNAGSGGSGTTSRTQAVTVTSGALTSSITDNGGNQPHNNVQPTMQLGYIIRVL